jgi:hypothetical protein
LPRCRVASLSSEINLIEFDTTRFLSLVSGINLIMHCSTKRWFWSKNEEASHDAKAASYKEIQGNMPHTLLFSFFPFFPFFSLISLPLLFLLPCPDRHYPRRPLRLLWQWFLA